jgi:hypothetical protein
MKRVALICSAVVLVLFCMSTRVTARTIAYEGCDYEVTNNVNGLDGGSGWVSAWSWDWVSRTKWW